MQVDASDRLSAALCCAMLLLASFCARAADPRKVLHVAFVAPENGFDPQTTADLYSNYVNREIFDARPLGLGHRL